MNEPRICHEASGVIGVAKPAGMPTQAPRGIESVEAWLRRNRQPPAYLGVPHRLDRAVSGIMVFASTPRAARQLSRQFERRQVRKTYVALVSPGGDGRALERLTAAERSEAGGITWTDAIAKVADEPRVQVMDIGSPDAKEATTLARLLGALAGPDGLPLVMLLLQPLTGRMHQLRAQAAARGLPILGDTLYGCRARLVDESSWSGWSATDPRAAPIGLHAWRLSFADPDTNRPITLEAPLPPSWPEACRVWLTADSGSGHPA